MMVLLDFSTYMKPWEQYTQRDESINLGKSKQNKHMHLNSILFNFVFVLAASFFNNRLDAKTATGSGRYSIQFFSTVAQGVQFQITVKNT